MGYIFSYGAIFFFPILLLLLIIIIIIIIIIIRLYLYKTIEKPRIPTPEIRN